MRRGQFIKPATIAFSIVAIAAVLVGCTGTRRFNAGPTSPPSVIQDGNPIGYHLTLDNAKLEQVVRENQSKARKSNPCFASKTACTFEIYYTANIAGNTSTYPPKRCPDYSHALYCMTFDYKASDGAGKTDAVVSEARDGPHASENVEEIHGVIVAYPVPKQ